MSTETSLPWNEAFSEFFTGIGLVETSECLQSELIILSRNQLEKLPEQLERLIEQLLLSLEKHVTAKEEILYKPDKTHPDLLIPKRKRGDDDDDWSERMKRFNSEQIQIRATNEQIEHRINSFIQTKQNELDESNRTEFLNRHDPAAEDVTCARTDAREINRNIQMKFDIVNNEDGPLARSLVAYNDSKAEANDNKNTTDSTTSVDMEERLTNIEDHLNVKYDPSAKPSFSVVERIKILEDTLIEIERQHPMWAAVHFSQPNRSYPPPPPVTYIKRPDTNSDSIHNSNDSNPISHIPTPDNSYISTQINAAPYKNRTTKLVGRSNSSLTRAVIEQLQCYSKD
ncbi:hypothetical protein BDB01DRAFT_794236 [Pilobolus umbonatus]|nr:hypothetical protein BDB01DRAFT_794236 [Pilobolus umbonatus]